MHVSNPDLERDIQRRIDEGPYRSIEDLLYHALLALDAEEAEKLVLERELLKGLEGEAIEMTPEDWAAIKSEARSSIREDS
ncbi:MAG: hypothetical protein SGI88_01870 [Candidatus Hydrogenedentes bacterium]|nr:hypothetical protein [Candidatus Hydrogenedentota bacterium]